VSGNEHSDEAAPVLGDEVAVARRHELFREVNEEIEQLDERWDVSPASQLIVLCECGDPRCLERIELPRPAYEAVRAERNRFLLKPGHQIADSDRVIETHDDYLVAENHGSAAEAATGLPPRREAR
jgi:hypothetical protein